MKKIKANTVLSSFIFGMAILLLCSFGTDTAYIILSRYKLQKIANAAALEYAASLGRNVAYEAGSVGDCFSVKENLERIYNSIGSGTLALRLESMEEKTNAASKESVVKLRLSSKVMPAFLRFVGAREIFIHANSYAKTNMLEVTKNMVSFNTTDEFGDAEDATHVIFSAPFIEGNKRADMVTSKANLNGDFAIKFGYFSQEAQDAGATEPDLGGGFFIFAGYETQDGVHWVDIGRQVKKRRNTDPDPWTEIASPMGDYYYCVNASGADFRPITVTFELMNNESPPLLGAINRFNHLRIYKAGGVTGTTLKDGTTINNPCDPLLIEKAMAIAPPAPTAYAVRLASEDTGELPSIGGDTEAGTGTGDGSAGSSGGDESELPSIGGDTESGGTSTPVTSTAVPNIFNRPAQAKFIILNNVSLISAGEYRDFTGTQGFCPMP